MFYELVFVLFRYGYSEDILTLQKYETKAACEEVVEAYRKENIMAYCLQMEE